MATQGATQELFDLWRRSLEEGTQAWLKAMGPMSQAPPSPPPFDFSQFWRPLLTQGMDVWQQAAAQGKVSPEFMQQWKAFMDQWIEVWSRALGQAMASEGFAQALGRYMDQFLSIQGPAKKAMEQYNDVALKTLGLPSRGQVVGVAAQVVNLEERIERVEDRLDELKALITSTLRAVTDHEEAAQRRAARPKEGA
jgi:Poly(R)-hydroxyalkanoic acid synthase subunit (PHA_synth_III_E)